MKIKNIDTGFPVNITYRCTPENIEATAGASDPKDNIKVELRCTTEQKRTYTQRKVDELFGRPVKLVYEVEDARHVRSPGIPKMRGMGEKLSEYMRVNGLDDTPELHEALDEMESSLPIAYSSASHMFTLLRVDIRGAVGLMEGSGLEDYGLDFTSFTPGVVALCGDCGRGKSTLIENCQPYLRMLTRGGKLQDHFRLKDSHRKLLYVDEAGTYYRIEILVDGKTKSGKVRAFASTGRSPDELKPVPGLDGNSAPYEEWVDKTFGPVSLFLRTAFYTRGNTGSIPDLSAATRGEKRELFSSLLGLEKLGAISLAARERKKSIAAEADKVSALVDDRDFGKEMRDLKGKLDLERARALSIKGSIADTRNEIAVQEGYARGCDTERMESIRSRVSLLDRRSVELKSEIQAMRGWADVIPVFLSLRTLSAEKSLREESLKVLRLSRTEVREEHMKAKADVMTSRAELNSTRKSIELMERNLSEPIDGTCPTCGQPLPPEKLAELSSEMESRKAELEAMREALGESSRELESLEAGERLLDDRERVIAERASELEAEIAEMDGRFAETLAGTGMTWDGMLDMDSRFGKKRLDDLAAELDETLRERDRAEFELGELKKDAGLYDPSKLSGLRGELDAMLFHESDSLTNIGRLEGLLKGLSEAEEKSEAAKAKAESLRLEAWKYETLERTFGANGLQALELEAASPDVADITNNILERSYGDRFRLKFVTLREGSSGNLVEDFSISVENTETGTSKPLEWLSGGEGTWIKEALCHAFSVVRTRSQGAGFRTRFLDETDGALDHDSKLRYLKMIQAAHDEGGSEVTVLITHSSEIKDMIEQRVEL